LAVLVLLLGVVVVVVLAVVLVATMGVVLAVNLVAMVVTVAVLVLKGVHSFFQFVFLFPLYDSALCLLLSAILFFALPLV
jgi:hypothetical protein